MERTKERTESMNWQVEQQKLPNMNKREKTDLKKKEKSSSVIQKVKLRITIC